MCQSYVLAPRWFRASPAEGLAVLQGVAQDVAHVWMLGKFIDGIHCLIEILGGPLVHWSEILNHSGAPKFHM